MSTESLLSFLETLHEPVPLEGDRPFVLAGDRVWLVRSGRVDLFGVLMEDGRPAGSRRHVCRVAAGGILVALSQDDPPAGTGLLAVGAAGTRVVPVDGGEFRELSRDPRWKSEVGELIDGWIDTLCAGIAAGSVPDDVTDLSPGERLEASGPVVVRPRDRVGWIFQEDGRAAVLGRPQLVVNGGVPLPISRSAWLVVDAGATLTALDPRDVLEGPGPWGALAKLHRVVRTCVALQRTEAAAAEAERLERMTAANRGALSRALIGLASALDRRVGPHSPPGGDSRNGSTEYDELLAACRIVGEDVGIAFRAPPPNGNGRAIEAPLDRIARASNVRVRRVVLNGEWWREDNGPLLATLEDSNRPVALRRRALRGTYELHDPADGSVQRVNAEVAAGLMPVAHAFYRPFRDSRVTALQVLKFGVADCGRDIATILVVGALAGLLATAPTIATGILFNSVIPSAARSQAVQITVIMIAIAVATAMLALARSIAFLRIDGRMGAAVQAATWDRLLSLPMRFFRDYTAGELATRAMGVDGIRQVVSGTVATTLLGGVFSVFNFLLMFRYSAELAVRATGLLLAALVVTVVVGYLQLEKQRAATRIRARTSGVVLQLLSAVSKIRVAAAESRVFGIWADLFGAQRSHQYDLRVVRNVFAVFTAVFPTAAAIAIFASVGTAGAGADQIRTGDFVAFFAAFSATLAATLSTGSGVVAALNVVPLYEQAKPILETPPEGHEGRVTPGPLKGDIEAQHLVFRYAADGPLVLSGVSFVIRAGEFVAFAGPSGCGKSTILRLLLGFERPESGAIYFDGQELSTLDLREVRRQMGVVLQNGRVLSGDIFTNIVGSSLATLSDAWEAAGAAGLAEDIERMPMGMHTVITEGGGTLSGGQRQRLLIARAIVNRPRIILFDEATSALDNRTQAIVSDSLERLQATRIVIAHRLSTIINADRIFVVHGGRIVESGRYEELLARGGLFAELARRQMA